MPPAAAAAAEESRLASLRVAAAARLRALDAEAATRSDDLAALVGRRDAAEARLRARTAAIAPLLPLMERLALYPAETLLAVPGPPGDALRGLAVMHGMAAQLERDAKELRAEQVTVDTERRGVEERMAALTSVQAQVAAENRALDAQIAAAQAQRAEAERDGAARAAAEVSRRDAAAAARARTLRGAVTVLEAARTQAARQHEPEADATVRQDASAGASGRGLKARGRMSTPVAGTVVRGWGAPTDAGRATGLSFRAAPAARVIAPCGGRIRFAGPFRSYGALVILDCGGGYAFVLAGLERLDVSAGGTVLPGEPVGVMPGWTTASGDARPALYVELRHDGQAVDPAPFFRDHG